MMDPLLTEHIDPKIIIQMMVFMVFGKTEGMGAGSPKAMDKMMKRMGGMKGMMGGGMKLK